MKLFIHTFLTVLASLALCTGCEITDNPTDTSTQVDGVTQDAGSDIVSGDGADETDTNTYDLSWDEITVPWDSRKIIVSAKTPDGKPATFYVCDEPLGCDHYKNPSPDDHDVITVYKNVTEFHQPDTASTNYDDGGFTIYVERDNHLFVERHFNTFGDKNSTTPIEYANDWTETGSWGLAPNGTYVDSFDGNKKTSIVTTVKNGKVTLTYANTDAIVMHDQIAPDDQNPNKKISGTISEDLSVIQLQIVRPNNPDANFTTTLTLVK